MEWGSLIQRSENHFLHSTPTQEFRFKNVFLFFLCKYKTSKRAKLMSRKHNRVNNFTGAQFTEEDDHGGGVNEALCSSAR